MFNDIPGLGGFDSMDDTEYKKLILWYKMYCFVQHTTYAVATVANAMNNL